MLPLLYVSRLDVTEDGKAPFAEWYARRHAPDLISVGFLSVSSFRAVRGKPEICNLYELRDLDAFGERYAQVRASDEEGARLQRNSFNGALAVYEQLAIAGPDIDEGPGPPWRTSLTAPVVSTLLFSADADDEVIAYYESGLARSITNSGALSGRLGRQVEAGRPNREPRRWSAFLEWANLADAVSWADSGVIDDHLHALGPSHPPAVLHVMRREFTRANPHLWVS
jgi:hypothetical protein